ncbi:MAG: GNAT family N-acetyltransferase [Rhodospirillales bacterium]|nr:GNAT family N-acetyltransferase [Acetobacter sp.]
MKIVLYPAEEADFEFAFEVKRQALGPYVEARWGWNDDFQRELHRKYWNERPWSIIVFEDQKVGTVAVTRTDTYLQFDEFYLLPSFQKQGIGTEVLQAVTQQADAAGLPIRLQHLKWNPVGALYKRHGFALVAENDTHFLLERAPRRC